MIKTNRFKSVLPFLVFSLFTLVVLQGCVRPQAPDKPNIIIIMSDDMGYSDIGCYGSEIKTSNLDDLAYNGLRFTQFYNTARCCPTRASLLTGLYPHQTGLGWMVSRDDDLRGYQAEINDQCVTIAEVMKPAGYKNYMVGKWHVTQDLEPEGPMNVWPLQRGFDKFYGILRGATSLYDPATLVRGNQFITPENDPDYKPDEYYFTDAISDNAVSFIREHPAEEPFFMYVAYTAAHWPMHAPRESIEHYKGRYDSGWDPIREERYKRMQDLNMIRDIWELSPAENGGWENEPLQEWSSRRMEVYAAMVEKMDQGIGKIVDELKQNGMFENTLIFYLQDNGGCAEEHGTKTGPAPENWESMPLKPMDVDELQPDMVPKYTRDGRPVRTGRGVMPGPANTYIAYGQEWANVSNTPFREYKHWVHEGGISTPLIVSWPSQITAKGEFRSQPGHLIDLMATCVDAGGAEYPTQDKGQDIIPMEGKSLLPVFRGHPIEREAIYWEHEMNRAVRVGDWKLVSKGSKKTGKSGPWELYNIEEDRSEMHDMSEVHPERVRKLTEMWEAYAERTHVYPLPWGK